MAPFTAPLIRNGDRFRSWTVIDERRVNSRVLCRCDCGTERRVFVSNLRDGSTTSCGCMKSAATSRTHFKHGVGYSDYRYRLWHTIRGKCLRSSHQDYPYYGGRGITMHPAWVDDFTAFAAYLDATLGPRPEGLTLDRIDNSGNYEPGNLRWASRQTQALNRRSRWRNRVE